MSQDQTSQALRLIALDGDDLAVLSAHLQDALLNVGDMLFLRKEKRFVLTLKRFDWLTAATDAPERAQCGLHFERVMRVTRKNFRQDRPDDILNLLDIAFYPAEAPSGAVELVFSGGCAVRLEVECLEAGMADLGPRWGVRHAPGHRAANLPDA